MTGGSVPARRPKRMIGSAVGRLLAVFDTAADADAAIAALEAVPAIDRARIERFDRPEDAPAFDASGRRRGWRGRLFRIVEFSWADQAPDFAWYEAAVREGKVVISVPVRGALGRVCAARGETKSANARSERITTRRGRVICGPRMSSDRPYR